LLGFIENSRHIAARHASVTLHRSTLFKRFSAIYACTLLEEEIGMKKIGLVAFALVAAGAHAQIEVPSFMGQFELNGGSYGGSPLVYGDILRMLANSGNSSSSASFAPQDTPSGNTVYRSMVRFTAGGAGNFLLPSDREGNMSSANSGDQRVFGTWSNNVYPSSHTLSAEVSQSDPNSEGYIDVEVREAPRITMASTGGWGNGLLDNSIYDIDPAVGSIVINKDATPSISNVYNLGSVDFTRGEVTWSDNTTSASLHRDHVFTGAWMWWERPSEFFVGSVEGSNRDDFAVGEGAATKSVAAEAGLNMSFDMTQVGYGTWTVKHWGIGWAQEGYDSDLGFSSYGFVLNETIETVNVVPEPGTMAALGAGALMLIRRRTRK
jgi:hypothetical protein